MNQITPIETNTDLLPPLRCICLHRAVQLSNGIVLRYVISGALVAGNTIVYKPATDTPWTGLKLYEVYRDAGLPGGSL